MHLYLNDNVMPKMTKRANLCFFFLLLFLYFILYSTFFSFLFVVLTILPFLRHSPCLSQDSLKMVCVRPIQKGEEVFNTYGQMANWQLLHMYGFTESYQSNSNDTADIPITSFHRVASQGDTWQYRKRDVLRKEQMWVLESLQWSLGESYISEMSWLDQVKLLNALNVDLPLLLCASSLIILTSSFLSQAFSLIWTGSWWRRSGRCFVRWCKRKRPLFLANRAALQTQSYTLCSRWGCFRQVIKWIFQISHTFSVCLSSFRLIGPRKQIQYGSSVVTTAENAGKPTQWVHGPDQIPVPVKLAKLTHNFWKDSCL